MRTGSQRESRSRAYLLLLVAAVAASTPAGTLAQLDVCPDITMSKANSAADTKQAVIQACRTTGSFVATPSTCGACQCALVAAVAPLLQESGAILPSEMYTASAVISMTSTLKNCSREFAVQLLETDPSLKLSQLLSLDECVADEKVITQCLARPVSAADSTSSSNATARSADFGNATDGSNTLNEILRDASCALAAAGNNSEYADDCASKLPATSSWIVIAPLSDTSSQGLRISSKTTRGPVAWKAGCWCDESYDPVCDPATRKQYPNPCSAKCQFVSQTVPCSSLPPLIRRSQVPGAVDSTVYVYDESMVNPTAAAFEGPIPPAAPLEADEDTQMFYYYYDDDVDDTQDALDITTGFYKAMMAAKYGDESANAAAISKSVSAALKAAARSVSSSPLSAAAAANQTVQGQDGPTGNSAIAAAANMTSNGQVLQRLRNMTRPVEVIARLRQSSANSGRLFRNAAGAAFSAAVNATDARRGALLNATQTIPERRSSVHVNAANQPATPSWLSTQEPGQAAGVYTRDPQRSSRILAALQAAAKQAGDEQQAAEVVVQLGPGLQGLIDGVKQAVTAQADDTPALPFSGGLLREALNSTGALLNATTTRLPTNGTLLRTLNTTVANATAAMANASSVRPFDITAFSEMLEKLNNASSTGSARGLLPSPSPSNRSSSGNSTGSAFAAFRMAVGSNTTAGNSTHISNNNSTGKAASVKTMSTPQNSVPRPKTGRRLLAW